MEQAYGYMLDVPNTDNVTCMKYRHSSHLRFIPFHISLAMESHFCGPVTAEALPRKVRVPRTFFETFFSFSRNKKAFIQFRICKAFCDGSPIMKMPILLV